MTLARARGLRVIEDAAQAHGARYRGRRVGTIGDAGTFSFYPAKNLGAWGDGGAVVTGDERIAQRVRLLRSHGESPRYHHRMIGTTARLDAIQAAVLQRQAAPARAMERGSPASPTALRETLKRSALTVPAVPRHGCDHVYHQFVVRCSERDDLREHFARAGIATGIHYPIPIHRSEAYAALAGRRDVAPVATRLATENLSLPIFPGLSTEQIRRIGDVAASFGEDRTPVGRARGS